MCCQGRFCGSVRQLLNLRCPCGLPQGHQQKCSYQIERNLIVNEGPIAHAISEFAKRRREKFLETRPELKMAVEYFDQGAEEFPQVKEPLGKLYRFGTITPRQAEIVLKAYEDAQEHEEEEKGGHAGSHNKYNRP
jgi:hypothetical protein